MKPHGLLWLFLFTLAFGIHAHAADPVVTEVHAVQRTGQKLVDISYRLTDPDGGPIAVSVSVTASGTPISASSFSGDIGPNVSPGLRHIVWNAGADWDGQFSQDVRFTVTADDGGVAGDYMVIDLSAGPSATSYPVSYLTAVWSRSCIRHDNDLVDNVLCWMGMLEAGVRIKISAPF